MKSSSNDINTYRSGEMTVVVASTADALDNTSALKRAIIYIRVSTKAQSLRDGNPEGYSLPTQRTACHLRAEQLGAEVIDEYIDRDTATRVEKRPAMLDLIERVRTKKDVDFVIVHQLSRFARNRLDDAQITEGLELAGATLVSCMEGIDQTTSGRMLQGMLAVVNEYQSRSQGEDIKRKTLQKVRDGGTPTLAPIGYLNCQGDGSENNRRWVEVDPNRAPLIRWAFEAYASGNHSLKSLAKSLAEMGLEQRPTGGRPARPLPANKLQHVLRNRYYLGVVTYNGVEYDGKHEPLVTPGLFEEVQKMLASKAQAGERAPRHTHYLKGSLFCGRCGSRMAYCISRGNGGQYAYFFCLGRHHKRTDCDLPHLNPDEVENAIIDCYKKERLDTTYLEGVKSFMLEDLEVHESKRDSRVNQLRASVSELRNARRLIADRTMDGSLPLDIAKEKQVVLATKLAVAETELERRQTFSGKIRIDIDKLFDLAGKSSVAYERSAPEIRKEWNFACFDALEIDVDDYVNIVVRGRETPIFQALRNAEIPPPENPSRPRRTRTPVHSTVNGSTVELLVEVMGFEPTASTLRT